MEQEAQQNLARLVPEELEVWETNTKAIWELITTGASCTQYCFCADCLAEGIKELYGFASPAECVEKLKLLASAWEGQVIVSTDWSGPGSERVDVVFQVL
jgi:hypothetical protein